MFFAAKTGDTTTKFSYHTQFGVNYAVIIAVNAAPIAVRPARPKQRAI